MVGDIPLMLIDGITQVLSLCGEDGGAGFGADCIQVGQKRSDILLNVVQVLRREHTGALDSGHPHLRRPVHATHNGQLVSSHIGDEDSFTCGRVEPDGQKERSR